jgi:hypothetical protein
MLKLQFLTGKKHNEEWSTVKNTVLAPPEFGVSEKGTEREFNSLLLLAPPDLKTRMYNFLRKFLEVPFNNS